MPYIKKEDRPFYNAIINTILTRMLHTHIGFNLKTETSVLAEMLNSIDLKSVDGHFNYFITKLLIDVGLLGRITFTGDYVDILANFLVKLLKKVYPPKYFNYNRAIGMLTCCMKEFRRRFGDDALAVEDFLEYVIDRFYLDIVGPYEDKKIAENGDLE